MLGIGWMSLIEQIPENQHDGLGLITSSGIMINIQSIMRMEEQYLVARGRLMGSTDAGRSFFVPYDQIDCVYFQRFLKEDEVHAWFGDHGKLVDRPRTEEAGAEIPTEAPVEAVPTPGPAAPAAAQVPAAARAPLTTRSGSIPLPGKAAILERLRKRSPGESAIAPKPPGASGANPPPK